jgi:hypothetical protein
MKKPGIPSGFSPGRKKCRAPSRDQIKQFIFKKIKSLEL